MNLFQVCHRHIFIKHNKPTLSPEKFFFEFGFSKSFLCLRLYLLTVENVFSNKKIYSGEEECDLTHTDVQSWPVTHKAVITLQVQMEVEWLWHQTPVFIQDFHSEKVTFNEGLISMCVLCLVGKTACEISPSCVWGLSEMCPQK